MNDTVEVHYDRKNGELSVACGKETFSRIRDFVCKESQFEEIVKQPTNEIRTIEIQAIPKSLPLRWHWQLVAQLGCILSVSLVGMIFIIGLATIFGWIRAGK